MDFDERDLYTGLAALHWSVISVTDRRVDQAFYQTVIERNGGKALELGCGAGRLLLAYLKMGLDVEGVDISADQLSMCRKAAEADGLSPVLYEQEMQSLDLPHRYNTIYIPCGSFQCVMGRKSAIETLKRCRSHLESGGVLAFNVSPANQNYYLDKADHAWPGDWVPRADRQLEDGRRLVVHNRKIFEDTVEQYSQGERRYQLYEGDLLVKEEVHIGQTHWYHRNELLWMLELAGFSNVRVTGDFSGEEFTPQHSSDMVFVAIK